MTLICQFCRRTFWVSFTTYRGARYCAECGRIIVGNCVTGAMPGDTLRASVAEPSQQRSEAA